MVCGGRGGGCLGGGGGGAFGLGSLLLLLLGVTWFVYPPVAGTGLQCYDCDGKKCDVLTEYKETTSTCEEHYVGCGVIVFEDEKGEYSRVQRRCAKQDFMANYNPGAEERCGDGLTRDKDRKLKWCFCKTSLCNVGDGTSLGDDSSNGKGSGDGNSDTIKRHDFCGSGSHHHRRHQCYEVWRASWSSLAEHHGLIM